MFTLRYQGGDPVLNRDIWPSDAHGSEQWACNHASTARAEASSLAARVKHPIQVLRGAKIAYIMRPDGTVQPPEGAIQPPRMNCTRGSGRACFCQPCRDERKAER